MPEPTKVTEMFTANPQIAEVEIGVRNLRRIKVYPLSLSDQLETTDLISQAITAYTSKEEIGDDATFVALMLGIVKDNIIKILGMVTEFPGEEIAEDISNVQAVRIAEIVYDVNFGEAIKNAQSLIEKVREVFPSMRPSQESVKNTEDTGLRTFTESTTETEGLPSDN